MSETPLRIAVVPSRFGEVMAELAEMLADELVRSGSGARLASLDDVPPSTAAILLVGSGPEFDSVGAKLRQRARPRPRIALWALDPLPPPGSPAETLRQGLRRGALVNHLRKLQSRLPHAVRAMLPSVASAPRLWEDLARPLGGNRGRSIEQLAPLHGADRLFAFSRLEWLRRSVAQGWLDHVFVSSPGSAATLAEHGVTARYVPVGYHPRMGRDDGGHRDLDVVFLGRPYGLRSTQLRSLSATLARREIGLTVVDRACYGEARVELLNRARISLNLHKYPWHLERIRLLLSMACGALVVSEPPLPDPDPFVPGRHLVVVPPGELADVVVYYLEHERERRRIVESAWRLITGGHTMASVAASVTDTFENGSTRSTAAGA